MENDQTNNSFADTEALKKELKDFIATAKKEKERIEDLAVSIYAKAEDIEIYYGSFTDLRTKLTDGKAGMQALLDQSTNVKNQIDQLGASAQEYLEQITEKVNSIKVKIQEIESYYGTFTDLKSKINDDQTGLQALLSQSTALRNNINKIGVNAQTALDQINSKVNSIAEKVQEIEKYYTSIFIPLKAKIDDGETGLQAVLGSVINFKNEIIKTKSGADDNFREIKNLKDQSVELRDESEKSKNEIEELKKKSAEFKDSIGETLELVTASSLTDSFIKRSNAISQNVLFWKRATLISVLFLGMSVLFIYYLQNKAPDGFQNWHSWYRYLFTSPLIYLVYLCSHNYNMERDYEEKYAFKTVLSTSLQAYIKLLSNKFSDKKEELLRFALTSIERIYREPYYDRDESQEVYGGFKNIFNFGLKNNASKAKVITDIAAPQEVKKEST